MAWTPGDKPDQHSELAEGVMELVRDQLQSLAARIDRVELVRSKAMREIVSDLGILADMARGVFEALPRPTAAEPDDEDEDEDEPKE
jgi:hypothetical protein